MFINSRTPKEEALDTLLEAFHYDMCFEECPCEADCNHEFVILLKKVLRNLAEERGY